MFLLPLPLSLPPSSIRTSSPSSLNSGRQRVIYCAAKEIERESGRTATAGGLRYSSGSSYFAAPQHNRRRLGVAHELCVYCSGVINGTHLAPRVPDGAQRQGRQRRAGGRGRRGGKIGRIYQTQNGRKREGKGSRLSIRPRRRPRRRPSALFLMIVLEWFVAAGSR